MMSSGNGTILEDDQQLYDWGIENRLDQYYQDDPNGESYASSGGSSGQGQGPYYPRNYDRRQSSDYASPPPAHQEAGYSHGQGRIKEEPGVDMSGWNYAYSRKPPLLPPSSPHGHSTGQFPAFSLDTNEALKVERKRARNRIAASKCRMRKIEKINTLDQETSKLKAENDELAGLAAKLKEQVYKLQQELQWHVNNGCQVSERANKISELIPEMNVGHQTKLSQNLTKTRRQQIESPDSTTTVLSLEPPEPVEKTNKIGR